MGRFLLMASGLILFILLIYFCLSKHAPQIQESLTQETRLGLVNEGLEDLVDVQMDGRELLLSGVVPDEASKAKATEVASKVYGIRSIDNQLFVLKGDAGVTPAGENLIENPEVVIGGSQPLAPDESLTAPASPELFVKDIETSVTYRDNQVLLEGEIPDEASRSQILENLRFNLGDPEIVDHLTVVQGEADPVWQSAMNLGLKHFGGFDEVKMVLRDNTLIFTGSTSLTSVSEETQNHMAEALEPDYQTIFEITVTEPEVTEPEVTEPEVTEPEITEPEITEPEITEPEITEPEITEPKGIESEGIEPEGIEPEGIEPEGIEPEDAGPEVTNDYLTIANPYISEIGYDGSKLTLSGYVPDEATRQELLTSASRIYGVDNVSDQLQEAYGAPRGWRNAMETALYNLKSLAHATVKLADLELLLAGSAPSSEARRQVMQGVSGAIIEYDASYEIVAPEPEPQLEVNLNETCRQGVSSLVAEKSIHFAWDKADLDANAETLLNELATEIQKCSGIVVGVVGYTDSSGSDSHNQQLSMRRAQVVVDYLVNVGVNPVNLVSSGEGESNPVADNNSRRGRRSNRRIEFTVSGG